MKLTVVLMFMLVTTANAQTANIYGHIGSKPSEKDLAGAKIEILSTNGQLIQQGLSDNNGNYNLTVTSIKKETTTNKFNLSQNYPNPFNPTTTIIANIPKTGKYTLEEYDALGKLIDKETNTLQKGQNKFTLTTPSAGVYFYRLTGQGYAETKKMISLSGNPGQDHIKHEGTTKATLKKTNSTTLDSLIIRYSAENHYTQQLKVPATNQEINVWLEQIPLETIQFKIYAYNTAGEKITNKKLLELTYPDNTKDTAKTNNNGEINIIKKIYEETNNKNIEIKQINQEYLGWQTYIDTNKTKINHIAQNWNPNNPVNLNTDSTSQHKEIELYLIPKHVKLPNGATLTMDSDTAKSMIGRTIYDMDKPYITKLTPTARAPLLDIIIAKFDLSSDELLPEEYITRSAKYALEATKLLTMLNQRILIETDTTTFTSWDDEAVDKIYNKAFENTLITGYAYTAFPDGQTNVFIFPENDTIPARIHDAKSSYRYEEPDEVIFGSTLSAITNTQAPFSYQDGPGGPIDRPFGLISDYTWDKEKKEPAPLARHLVGIAYLFKIGTDYKGN